MVYNMTMGNDKFEKALNLLIKDKYYGEKDLEYNKDVGILFSPYEYKQFVLYKEQTIGSGKTPFTILPLKTFNSKYIYLSFSNELSAIINSYTDLLIDDANENKSFLTNRHFSDFYKSRLYSEIEGSVNVENVPTTRRRLKELLEENFPAENRNDRIIQNMNEAIKFVHRYPEFNKENLYKLYSLLSKDCLNKDDELRAGEYYRYDSVEVDNYLGCPHQQIEECMDSLFKYVNNLLNHNLIFNKFVMQTLLPHICHYYILYIHPYFDYNGRTARMVSYWIYLLTNLNYYLPVISEAINQTKSKYYRSIEETRNSNNDITYFLKYIFTVSIDYALCYKNLENIDKHSKNKGIILTDTEMNYVKKIIISCKDKFTYSDFLKACDVDMSKQGAFKLLNKFVECDILNATTAKSKVKLFEINNKVVIYKTNSF